MIYKNSLYPLIFFLLRLRTLVIMYCLPFIPLLVAQNHFREQDVRFYVNRFTILNALYAILYLYVNIFCTKCLINSYFPRNITSIFACQSLFPLDFRFVLNISIVFLRSAAWCRVFSSLSRALLQSPAAAELLHQRLREASFFDMSHIYYPFLNYYVHRFTF